MKGRSRRGDNILSKDESGISASIISISLIVIFGIGLVGSSVYYSSKISTLKSEKTEIQENLEELEATQKQLLNEFETLEEKHNRLIDNYEKLDDNFRKIENNYRSLSENYSNLKFDYELLKENYQSLSISFLKLEDNYLELEENNSLLENSYENLLDKYSTLEENYSKLKEFKDSLSENYEGIENELSLLREGNRYELHDSTYSELKEFLDEDTTDENTYNENTYVCFDFSKDLIANALDEGLMVGYVRISYWENYQYYTPDENNRDYYAHAIVAFQTVDEGIEYVEPQNDVIMEDLEVGDSYWDEIEKNSPLDYVEWPKMIIADLDLIW